ncbi:MAG: two-component regulator propeller domain-containing protein [Salinivirgaceae bacterium]
MNLLNYIKYLLIALLLIASNCYSQENLYQFIHLNNEDGLSQNTVTSVCQDQYGFIWLATFNGLNRYDGYHIVTFFNNENDSTSLSYNDIEILFNDSKGRLWVGTFGGGVNIFNHTTQHFNRYIFNPADNNSISSNDVTDIFENPKETIWIATLNGLNRFNEESTNFTRYQNKPNESNCISSNLISCIHSNNPKHLWIGTKDGGLNKLDLITNQFTFFNKAQGNTIKDDKIWSLHEDTKNRVLIGGEKEALTIYNQNNHTFKYYGYTHEQLTNQGENLVRSIVPGVGDDFWIGSDGGGLYQLNHTLNYFREYRYDISKGEGLANNSVSKLFKDKHDMLWIGMIDHGVDRINLHQKPFYHITYNQNPTKGLKNNGVSAILEDSEGNYWIATDGGLTISNDQLNSFTHFNEKYNDQTTINNNAVVSLQELKNGEIWTGTYLGGINIYNKKTKTFRYLTSDSNNPNSLSSNFVRSIYEDNAGLIWIGTMGGGLDSYNRKTGSFNHYLTSEKDSIKSTNIMCILPDKNEHLYIAAYGDGLIVYDKSSGTSTSYTASSKHKNSISSNQVTCLLFDTDSTLWIGTVNGLNAFNTKTQTFTNYFKPDGLSDNLISAMVEDRHKNLWISTSNGITKFNIQNKETKKYYKDDGLQGKEFNLNSSLASNNGLLFFGGFNGITYFNPDSIHGYILEPEIQFTELSVIGQTITLGDTFNNKIVLTEPIYKAQTITLSYEEPFFTIYFSGFLFNSVGKTNYAYRLPDTDTTWFDIGTTNYITFHKFPYGKHRLEVRATNSEGSWSKNTKSIIINYQAPFWKTLLFKALLILLLASSLLLFNFLRNQRNRKQKRLLEKTVHEKTTDLQEINLLLEEKQAEMEVQQEEIVTQRDLTFEQNQQILKQNEELEMIHKNLEKLVEERTKELVEAKEQAEKGDELKTAFLANMSHEIRTPMNAILGFLEILDNEEYSKEQRIYFKKIINSSGHTLLNLIDDIIDIAKIESGQITLHNSTFSLMSLFEELHSIYTKKITEDNPNLNLYIDSLKDIVINSDKLRIKQVMINLLDNAIKFTESGSIHFGYQIKNNKILCFVKDTGIGVSKEDQTLIFDRFRKIETKNSKLFRGAGLGLAISKHIILLLGGSIWIESQPGLGSTFYFIIPLPHES